MPLRVLRILLYVQLLLGLVKYTNLVSLGHVFDIHQLIGVVVFLLAIWALRPQPGISNTGVRIGARFIAVVPLILGLSFIGGLAPNGMLVGLHMLFGIATIALVEMASAQERRSIRRRGSFVG